MRILEDVSLLQIALAAHYQTCTSRVFVSPSDFADMHQRAYDTITNDGGDWFTVATEIGELTIARDEHEPDYDWRV